MSASNYVHVEVQEIVAETAKAFLMKIADEQLWVPVSQIADAQDYKTGDKDVEVSVTEWFAARVGLKS